MIRRLRELDSQMFHLLITGILRIPLRLSIHELLRINAVARLCTSAVHSLHYFRGDGEIRTHDPLLARQVLSQLSYTPVNPGTRLLSHIVSNAVPSAA